MNTVLGPRLLFLLAVAAPRFSLPTWMHKRRAPAHRKGHSAHD